MTTVYRIRRPQSNTRATQVHNLTPIVQEIHNPKPVSKKGLESRKPCLAKCLQYRPATMLLPALLVRWRSYSGKDG